MSFIYADNLCITAQYPTFTEVEDTIEEALSELTQYYRNNSLRVNPDKTQVTTFHLRNREVKRSLNIAWNGVDLENTAYPKYMCHSGQNSQLQTAHTEHEDEGGNPQ